MSELNAPPNTELAALQERLTRLAREKAQLQLIAALMNRLGELPGLEKTAEGIVQFVMEILGGQNVTIYYRLDGVVHRVDVHGRKEVGGEIDDDLTRQVFATGEAASREHGFSQTGMLTKEFTKATTWVMPLLVGAELVGVLRIDDLLVARQELHDEVQTFLRYASLLLKNEISSESRLRKAFAEVRRTNRELTGEIAERRGAESALLKAKAELEQRVAERTTALRAANDQLRLELAERARAESALSAEHSLLRGILEGTTSSIFSVDRGYRYLVFNRSHASSMRDLYGVEIEVGHSLLDYMSMSEDRRRAKANLDRALSGEHLVESVSVGDERRTRRWFEIAHHPIRADQGEILGVAVLADDITERKRAEDEIFEAQQVFRTLVEASPDIIARYDRDCRRTYVNPKYLEVARIPPPELLATAPIQRSPLPPASATKLQELLRRVLDGGSAEAIDVVWPKEDGVEHWYNVFAYPELDREGHVVSTMTVSREITARVQAERELVRVNRVLRMLSDSNQALIRIADEATLLQEVCRIAVEVGGYCFAWVGFAEQDAARSVRAVAHAGPDTGYVEAAQVTWGDDEGGPAGIAIRTGLPCVLRSIRPDAASAPWREAAVQRGYRSAIALPLNLGEDGLGALLIYSGEESSPEASEIEVLSELAGDLAFGITALRTREERKRIETEVGRLNVELESRVERRTAELAEAVEELESFSYSVSHDLRAPVRAIDGFSGLLEAECGDALGDEGRRLVQVIRRNTRKMGQLIDDLLGLSRSSRAELRKTRIDMTSLVEQILGEALPAGERARTEVRLANLPMAWGDPALVRVVLQNLLSNALKYSAPRDQRRIEIGARAGDSGPEYFVRDNGVGFDSRYAGKLFDVFQRLHSETEFEGTGIGLALVRRIVTRHGGKVWAEGEVDRGATFWFTLAEGETA